MKTKNIFITGGMHIGKTTIIKQVVAAYSHLIIGGFRTAPIYEDGHKKGFMFESLRSTKQIFAHVDLKTENQFDIYKFDLTIFEETAALGLKQALQNSDLIVMDEIGMMERQAPKFTQAILECLNSDKPILGAFQQRATWFAALLNRRVDTRVFHVTELNRNLIADQIMALIG